MNLPKILAWAAQPLIILAGYCVVRAYISSGSESVSYYRNALFSFLTVVFLMESRVLFGRRGKRDSIFYIHLMSGCVTLGILFLLGFRYTSPLLEIQALFFSSLTICTGLFILHR